jgi:CRISPR/Cas system CSM-associated protein Csm4 (group 5 of RAMP superfamily)
VDSIYHSDSVYSAVTSAMARLGWLEEWLEATARRGGDAVVKFSSCFPFLEDLGFVVPPRTMWPPASAALAGARVRWRSARFVPLGIVQALLAGQVLDDNHWAVDGMSECLVPVGRPGPFRTGIRWSAAVDRLSGTTERHSTACIEFREGAGWWSVVSFADRAAYDRWLGPVKTVFRVLADSGFGGERSRGWGRAGEPEFIEGTLPDMILPAMQAADAKPASAEIQAPRVAAELRERTPTAEAPPEAPQPLESPAGEPTALAEELAVTSLVPATGPAAEASGEQAVQAEEGQAAEPLPGATGDQAVDEPVAEAGPVSESPALESSLPANAATPANPAADDKEAAEVDARPAEEPSASQLPEEISAQVIETPMSPEPPSEAPAVVLPTPVAAQLPEEVAAHAPETPITPEPPSEAPATPAARSAASQDFPQQESPVIVQPVKAEGESEKPAPLQAAAPKQAHWLLSLFTPATEDSVDWTRGNYVVIARGGRIDSPAGSGGLKKQVNMVAEGSVLYASESLHGAASDVAPDGFSHSVFRAGFALAIPLPQEVS